MGIRIPTLIPEDTEHDVGAVISDQLEHTSTKNLTSPAHRRRYAHVTPDRLIEYPEEVANSSDIELIYQGRVLTPELDINQPK
jgi:hypothetical protein